MASIHKDPRGKSPFWYCAFHGPDGGRKFKSTKERDHKEALRICFKWEQLSEMARRRELTAAQGRKVISEMVKISSGERMNFFSIERWLSEWLANKAGGVAEGTMLRYRQVVRDFLVHLGPTRIKASLESISPNDLVGFREKLRQEGRSARTCNMVVKKVLSVPFETARKMGFIPTNPVGAVDNLRDRGIKSGREPFSDEEIGRLLGCAHGDWHGAILLAVNTACDWATSPVSAGRPSILRGALFVSRPVRLARHSFCPATGISKDGCSTDHEALVKRQFSRP